MKKLLKFTGAVIGIILIILLGISFNYYSPDKPIEKLRERWAYSNSQFLTIDGMPVHYRINGRGMPLVLIHGTAASVHTWEKWTEVLEKDFKVISLDMPAFGLTGPNNDGIYSLEFYTQFLDKFLNSIEVDSLYLAGNSLGGAIAWHYGMSHPEKVKKLVLIDASGYPSNKETPLAFKLAKSEIMSQVLLNFTPRSLFKTSIKQVYYNDSLVTDQLIERYYDLYLRPGNRQAFINRVNNFIPTDTALIGKLKMPTLIMWGKEDEWISVDNAYRFQRDIKDAELIVYNNAGHVPMEEIPIKTAMDCREFLKEAQD